jgi:hypothetical protein
VDDSANHTQPPAASREQIQKELEAAGLLRHLVSKPGATENSAPRRPDVSSDKADLPSRQFERGLRVLAWLLLTAFVCLEAVLQFNPGY